jgi:Mg-chelatase subunit ChlD/DNA-binding beta-propeller fold protein YncE
MRRLEVRMSSFSRVLWATALLAVVGLVVHRGQDGDLASLTGSRVEARAQSASGAFVVADTWRSRPNVRPPDAWAQASGIERLPDGRVFVADGDTADPRITVLDPGGAARTLPTAPHLRHPVHIAADPARDWLYVADLEQNALVVFTLGGAWVETRRDIPGAYGVAVAGDGTVYVTASVSGEVHRFGSDGSRLSTWDVVPKSDGGALLAGVAVDTSGTVHILDGRNAVIHLRDSRGQTKADIEVPVGAKLADLVVEGENGQRKLWFAASSGLVWMDDSETPVSVPLGSLTSLAVDRASDTVLATSAPFALGVSQVARLGYGATLAGRKDPPVWVGGLLTPLGHLNGPERIEIGADGAAYVLDRFPRVQRFSRQGDPLRQMRLGIPLAVDAGPDGRIYQVDGDKLHARDFAAPDLDGTGAWQADLVTGGVPDAFVSDVVFDASQSPAQLVTLDITARSLRRYDLAGKPVGLPISLALPPGSADTEMWSDLALDGAGRAYVLNRTTRTVRTVARDGTLGTLTLKTPARRLAVGPDGTLFALTRDGLVWHYDAAATLLDVLDARRPDLSPVSRPTDLAVDAQGDLYITDRNSDAITRFTWDPNAKPPDPPPTEAVCQSFVDKQAAPAQLQLGGLVDISLSVDGACGASAVPPPMDIFLVLDNSGSMLQERKMEILRQAALDFVHEMDLGQSRIGVATFNHQGALATELTSEEGRLWRTINRITPFGGTQIDQGLKVGRESWLASRRPGVRTVFILLSDGVSDSASAMAEAAALKAEGVGLFTISVGTDGQLLMRDLATDVTYAYDTTDPNFLYGIFAAIIQRITAGVLFRTIEIVDQLPANMRYIEGSAVPVASFDSAARTLTWSFTDVSFAGLDLTYRVEPLAAGDWPTNVAAWADFVDGYGKAARAEFPVPRVLVVAPTATPTTTPTPSPTPTPVPRPVYIPVALREECVPEERYTDTVLVIDTSGSMEGAKFAAAKASALSFVRMMRFTPDRQGRRDQVAIVAFNTQARLVTELTSDQRRIEAAINGLSLSNGTWIDRGLLVALDEMQSGGRRRFGNTPTIVLLTDGRYSGDQPEEAVQALGDRVCTSKYRLYTIGLGSEEDVNIPFLRDLACDPSMAYMAPTPAELAGIYTQIAGAIPCAPETFWGGR